MGWSGGGGGGAVSGGVTTAPFNGGAIIPALGADPRIAPGGPNDDEFNNAAAGLPAGWAGVQSEAGAVTYDTLTDSFLHIHAPAAIHMAAAIKPAPAIPYTVTSYCEVAGLDSVTQLGGLALFDGAVSGNWLVVAWDGLSGTPAILLAHWTSWAFLTGVTVFQLGAWGYDGFWARFVVHAAANIDAYVSPNGRAWLPLAAGVNFLTAADHVGPFVGPNAQGPAGGMDGYFDCVRFS